MSEHGVVVAGGGPTGLVLAVELTLAGADVVVVEPRSGPELQGRRAGGLHARTIEVLAQRGVADRFLSEGRMHPFVGFAGTTLDMGDIPTEHRGVLALWQGDTERILTGWAAELGVPLRRGCEVVGFVEHASSIDVELSDGATLRAQYLVGCDGGRSTVRKTAGIAFPGWDPTASYLTAEVEMAEAPVMGMRPEGGGIGPVDPDREGGPYGVVLLEDALEHEREPTLADLRQLLVRAYGSDFGAHSPRWISRFTDTTRQAATYRSGRVLLAGDAAHVHGPQGGQGLNTGVQDAVNLGWKLAQVVAGTSPEGLLDTYHAERHPVGARVLRTTMAQVALARLDERSQALRAMVLEHLAMDEPRRTAAAMISALDVRYDLGEGHPLLGRRMPDVALRTAGGPTTAFALLHDARPVLLDLGGAGRRASAPRTGPVRTIEAAAPPRWELPIVGEVAAPVGALIRPDGHVAWTGVLTDPGLSDAVATWFGPDVTTR